MTVHTSSIKLFADRVNNIYQYAQRLGVTLAIENNVYSAVDHAKFGEAPPFVGIKEILNCF